MEFLRKAQVGLCSLLFASIAGANTHYPCSGEPGSFRINPDNSEGGFVSDSATVDATVTLSREASVCERATVIEGAKVLDRAEVSGTATVRGLVEIRGNAQIFGDAYLVNTSGSFMVIDRSAQIYGRSFLLGSVRVSDSSHIFGWAKILDFAQVYGASIVCGYSVVNKFEILSDDQSRCIQK